MTVGGNVILGLLRADLFGAHPKLSSKDVLHCTDISKGILFALCG